MLADQSVDAIITDPPYFRVKDAPWDRQWDHPDKFIAWIGELCAEWRRLLKLNGSLYVFASPRMAARVEVEIGRRFTVLNNIRWVKDAGWYKRQRRSEMRSFASPWESILFAEPPATDDDPNPLRVYLCAERDRAGFTTRRVAEEFQKKTRSRTVTGMAGHWFENVQWGLPTEENYLWLRGVLNRGCGHEYLRREYEDLRRPFSVNAEDAYTDIWDFKTVGHYPGKHLCEKPVDLLRHIVTTSTRPGQLILDCFAGSGSTGVAAVALGRKFLGVEFNEDYCAVAQKRIAGVEVSA
jgi:adenine-specific DNA-methyltransferase